IRLPPDARSAFLDRACANDASLRPEVELLLRLDREAQLFLESPPIHFRFLPEDRPKKTLEQTAELAKIDPDLTGERIGDYTIIRRIGAGGMGVVYRAHDTQLDRTVAIKVLTANWIADAGRRRRFRQEAKAASALNHPNIITIYSIVEEGGADCIVMEHVAG